MGPVSATRLAHLAGQGAVRAVCRFLPVAYRVPETSRRLYLTFDDGPDPVHTPAILDVLSQHKARATFFAIGDCVDQHPELAHRILSEGHSIGSHTYHHRNLSLSPVDDLNHEVLRGIEAIHRASGYTPTLFRPPYGRWDLRVLRLAQRRGLQLVLWSFDSQDSRLGSARELATRLNAAQWRPGEVILLHDCFAHTVEALPGLLSGLKRQGWETAPMPGGLCAQGTLVSAS